MEMKTHMAAVQDPSVAVQVPSSVASQLDLLLWWAAHVALSLPAVSSHLVLIVQTMNNN